MAPTVASSISNFIASVIDIAISILNSILSVFQAAFAVIRNAIESAMAVANYFIAMFVNLFRGAMGFVAGESGFMLDLLCHHVEPFGRSQFHYDSSHWCHILALYQQVSVR